MTAPHPAYMAPEAFEIATVFGLRTIGDVVKTMKSQVEADERAVACRELCLRLKVRQELFYALVVRASSEAVVRAAKQRFTDWMRSIAIVEYYGFSALDKTPTYEDASAEIVDTCIRLEREGLLERVVGGDR